VGVTVPQTAIAGEDRGIADSQGLAELTSDFPGAVTAPSTAPQQTDAQTVEIPPALILPPGGSDQTGVQPYSLPAGDAESGLYSIAGVQLPLAQAAPPSQQVSPPGLLPVQQVGTPRPLPTASNLVVPPSQSRSLPSTGGPDVTPVLALSLSLLAAGGLWLRRRSR
jgi:LPXTG-motif cell wall-anchored protein